MRVSSHAGAGPRRMASHEGGGAWPGGVGGLPPGPLGGGSLFGDGTYSGNVIQGGSVLQPQDGYSSNKVLTTPSFASGDGNTWIEKDTPLSNGAAITHLGTYHTTAGVRQHLLIFRDNGGGSVTVMARVDVTTTTAGWQYYALASEYIVPATGLYYMGLYSPDSSWWVAGSYANSCWIAGVGDTVGSSYGTQTASNAHAPLAYRRRVVNPGTPCIVVTGAATVAPDAETGASGVMCNVLVVDGGSLKPSTNSKGLFVFAKTGVLTLNAGTISTTWMGKAGNLGDIPALPLVPASIRRKIKNPTLDACILVGEGAAGGPGVAAVAGRNNGYAASLPLQAGGGGSGGSWGVTPGGNGGKGGPCAGGAGGGGNSYTAGAGGNAGDYGGPGGNAMTGNAGNCNSGGGAGDGVGTSDVPIGSVSPAPGAGGAPLFLVSPVVNIASGTIVQADGSRGTDCVGVGGGYSMGGGGAGGGIVGIITLTGGYTNNGTVRASGGAGGQVTGASGIYPGGAGGAGSVNILSVTP